MRAKTEGDEYDTSITSRSNLARTYETFENRSRALCLRAWCRGKPRAPKKPERVVDTLGTREGVGRRVLLRRRKETQFRNLCRAPLHRRRARPHSPRDPVLFDFRPE